MLLALVTCLAGLVPAAPTKADLDRQAALLQAYSQHVEAGRVFAALETCEALLQLGETTLGPDHPDLVTWLDMVAQHAGDLGDHRRAIGALERALALTERVQGPEHWQVGFRLRRLGLAYLAFEDLVRGDALCSRALALEEKLHGRQSLVFLSGLTQQASLELQRHALGRATEHFQQVLATLEQGAEDGPKSPLYDAALQGLAWAAWRRGDPLAAEGYWDRALARAETRAGPDDPVQILPHLQQKADRARRRGDAALAASLSDRVEKGHAAALQAAERRLGPAHSELGLPLMQLLGFYRSAGRWAEAEPLARRLAAIERRAYGADTPRGLSAQTLVAQARFEQGDAAGAAALYEPIVTVFERAQGAFAAAPRRQRLAELYRAAGRLGEAATEIGRVLAAYERELGKEHPRLGKPLEWLGVVELARGRGKAALRHLERSQLVRRAHFEATLAAGDEASNRTFLAALRYQLDLALTVALHELPGDKGALAFGVDMLLARKGRLHEELAGDQRRLREALPAEARPLADALASARARYARLALAGPRASEPGRHAADLAALDAEIRRLEMALRDTSPLWRSRAGPVTLPAIQGRLATNQTIVEFVVFRRFQPRASRGAEILGQARVAAFVLPPAGAARAVDLGSEAAIDARVAAFREALAAPGRQDVDRHGRALYDLVFAPFEGLLGGAEHVLVAPDGALSLVPFAALSDARGEHLVRRFTFSYLAAARDLLRLGEAPGQAPVIVANPAFAAPAVAAAGPPAGTRSVDLTRVEWPDLPGTEQEARALAPLLPGSTVWLGEAATEAALKGVDSPRVLHLATHGFFLPAEPLAAPEVGDPFELFEPAVLRAPESQALGREHPLVRSGLVLAHANRLGGAGEDGVLTALEAAGLDLQGTELVVLSACDSGLGDPTRGEGVQGLRRAFGLAGAQTVVMTLWEVDDEATRDLMTRYYQALAQGKGRAAALREVQLGFLASAELRHPYFWGAFIAAGQWGPLRP